MISQVPHDKRASGFQSLSDNTPRPLPINRFLAAIDDSFSGGEEALEILLLDAPGVYTIIISHYAGDGGGYLLDIELP